MTPSDVQTFGQLLRRWRMTRLDAVVFCGLRYYLDQPDPEEDGTDVIKHHYLILTPNPAIRDDEFISDDLLAQAFLMNYSLPPVVGRAKDNSFVAIGSFLAAVALAFTSLLISQDHDIAAGVLMMCAQFLMLTATIFGLDYKIGQQIRRFKAEEEGK